MLANGTLVAGKIVLSVSEPQLSLCFDRLDCERDLAAKNFYTISTDTHIDHIVILTIFFSAGAHKNAAGTVHFETLLDHHLLLALSNAMRDHPGGAAPRRRSGRRIVAVIKNHAGVDPGFRVDRFAADKVKKLPAGTDEIFARGIEIKAEFLNCLQ